MSGDDPRMDPSVMPALTFSQVLLAVQCKPFVSYHSKI